MRRSRRRCSLTTVVALALSLLLAAALTGGCASGQSSGTQGSAGTTFNGSSEGRPVYGFLEEWRRATQTARTWDAGAFLVQAFAVGVNDQGVPSRWTLFFRRPSDTAYLTVTMDPWGTVTDTHTLPSGAKPTWRAISRTILDSGEVATLGAKRFADLRQAALSRQQLQLLWAADGSGMQWVYVVYDADSHTFLGEVMDARTGARIGRKTFPVYSAP